MVNVSQDIARRAWGYVCPTLCKSSELFSYDRQRMIHPAEHLITLGFDISGLKLSQFSHKELKDLSGDSMAMPCVVTVMACVLHSLARLSCSSD